jgi:hypothetical protein
VSFLEHLPPKQQDIREDTKRIMQLLVVLQGIVNGEIKSLEEVGGRKLWRGDVLWLSTPVRRRQANLGIILSKSLADSNLDS